MFETHTDLILLGCAAAQQPNTSRIRTWEVAGTSHSGAYVTEPPTTGLEGCAPGPNLGTEHPVVQAAFAAFANWVALGTPPPAPTPFKLESTTTPTLALDDHGNVIGGVRTPNVVVPVSTLTGIPTQGAGLQCSLFGSISPFSSTALVQLYGTKKHYIDRYQQDLTKVIAEGYILPTDRAAILAQAEQVRFPS
jgi:Alpha/beta hydrolase domain